LRTNTLVALGSASFVLFAALASVDSRPTSVVAAQVVSGIGFLGAGVIFKEGLTVRGLNTAATLWCSAAVNGTSYAQSDMDDVKAAVDAYHAAIASLDTSKMDPLWAHDATVTLINPANKSISVGWEAVTKIW
jgi:MgtC family